MGSRTQPVRERVPLFQSQVEKAFLNCCYDTSQQGRLFSTAARLYARQIRDCVEHAHISAFDVQRAVERNGRVDWCLQDASRCRGGALPAQPLRDSWARTGWPATVPLSARTCRIALPFVASDAVVRRAKPSPCPSSVAVSLHASTVRAPSWKQASISWIAAARRMMGPEKFCICVGGEECEELGKQIMTHEI